MVGRGRSGSGVPLAMAKAGKKVWSDLRTVAMGFPEAWEDFPWGEVVVKVGRKIFVFLAHPDGDTPGITVTLTESQDHASSIEGAEPAASGMGTPGRGPLP